ncbi:MAG: HAD family phosphatase [Vampirovibrio sp.]|nr:HAD family phosphatase [Vampirovibrio sp.]
MTNSTSRIQAVIFDMDGVLIDAKDWHYQALNDALGQLGYLPITPEEHETTYDGLPTLAKLKALATIGRVPDDLAVYQTINGLKQELTITATKRLCRPYAPHLNVMQTLKAQGRRIAVASNSVRSSVDEMMMLSGLAPYLEFTLSNQDVPRAKPFPDLYLEALRLLALPASACLVVEDNPKGIAAAQAAGLSVLVVASVHEVTDENIQQAIRQLETFLSDAGQQVTPQSTVFYANQLAHKTPAHL